MGDDRKVLNLRPGITGPATLKYRLEDEMISDFMRDFRNMDFQELTAQISVCPTFRRGLYGSYGKGESGSGCVV